MSKDGKESLLQNEQLRQQEQQENFQPVDMFGQNYQKILDPRTQEQHQRAIRGDEPAVITPSTKIDFEEFNLGHQPTVPPQAAQSTGPILAPSSESDNMGFGTAVPPGPPTAVPGTEPLQPINPSNYKPWQPEYWTFLFNVDTKDVAQRISLSFVCVYPKFYDVIAANPDFYGPFWIATTLMFSLAAAGNVAQFFSMLVSGNTPTDGYQYNLTLLTAAAGVIYGFVIVLPVIWWVVCKCLKVQVRLLHLECIYGYSLFIYLPVSIICVVPLTYLRWVMVAVACIVSTSFLVVNSYQVFKQHMKQGFIILVIMALLHVGLALTCQLVFFTVYG